MSKRPKVSEMTLEQKIGQMMCVGQVTLFEKVENGKRTYRTNAEVEELVKKYQYGAMWNSGGVKMLVVNLAENDMKNKASIAGGKQLNDLITKNLDIPMLIGMDCEQGLGTTFEEASITPMGFAVGAANSEELAFEISAAIAREMKAVGANWRWAPMVDVSNRFCGVSLNRQFSLDYDKLSRLTNAAFKGLQSENVGGTVKHFPGADPYEFRDSHYAPAQIDMSLEEWEETQAIPFKSAIENGVQSMMVGHVAFPAVDDEMINGQYVPATASEKILNGLLRDKLGFDGVLVTDAIGMGGLSTMFSHEELLVRTINAGNDIILGTRVDDTDLVVKAVKEGKIKESTIDKACERILAMKEKMHLFDEGEQKIYDIREEALKTKEISKKIAEKSINLLYDKNNMLPLSKNKIKTVGIIFSSHSPNEAIDEVAVMKKAFEERGAEVTVAADIAGAELIQFINDHDLIIYAALIEPHCPMGLPSLYGKKIQTYVNAFSVGGEKSIGMSMGYPFVHIDIMGGAKTFINTYSKSAESQEAFVKALYGEIEFCTEAPLDLELKMRNVRC